MISYDPTLDATRIWKALKKDKKLDTDLLTSTLVSVSYEQSNVTLLKQKYRELYGETLVNDIRSGTSGNYRLALTRLLAGPGEGDAMSISKNDNTSMTFGDEKLVAEALFGKSPGEINSIKHGFMQLHGVELETALETVFLENTHHFSSGVFDSFCENLSAAFARACIRILRADRDVETLAQLRAMDRAHAAERDLQLALDVGPLYSVAGARPGAGAAKCLNQQLLLDLVLRRSDLYLEELCRRFLEVHGRQLPELVLAKDRTKTMTGPLGPSLVSPSPRPSPRASHQSANARDRAMRSHMRSRAPSTSRSATRYSSTTACASWARTMRGS